MGIIIIIIINIIIIIIIIITIVTSQGGMHGLPPNLWLGLPWMQRGTLAAVRVRARVYHIPCYSQQMIYLLFTFRAFPVLSGKLWRSTLV